MAITSVWIEEGCCVCNACETTCREIFDVTENGALIRSETRLDGTRDRNETARSPLIGTFGGDLESAIIEAAEGCPVEVIKFLRT